MSGPKIFVGVLATICIAMLYFNINPPEVPLPAVVIAQPDGSQKSLESFKGKVVLVDYWATWCGPCRMSIPAIQKLYEKYKADGFEVFGVALENAPPEKIGDFAKSMSMTYAVGTPVGQPGYSGSIPYMVLFDKKGNPVWRQEGYGPSVDKDLESKLKSLLNK